MLSITKEPDALCLLQAPYVSRNEALLLKRGETGSITDLLLDIRDNDNPQDVTVAILDSPRHGQLTKRVGNTQSVIHQFHLEDLSRGFVQYIHDGSSSLEDTVVLQASDGYHFLNLLFHVKIAPKVSIAIYISVRCSLRISASKCYSRYLVTCILICPNSGHESKG